MHRFPIARQPLTSLLLATLLLLSALAGASPPQAGAQAVPTGTPALEWVWREVFDPNGTITRVRVPKQREPQGETLSVMSAAVTPIQQSGAASNRFSFVFVGDGYTSGQLGLYAQHVLQKWNDILAVEPFQTYKNYFNVYRVDVISAESGVDNDPSYGVLRNTALDMYFWCANLQRLLCVNETKARQQASAAPRVDQILALANSTSYGGAGGNVATASGGNTLSSQIAIHELGHSVGHLDDEYVLTPGHYSGGEPPARNVSIYSSSQMSSFQTKWYRWLGASSPDGSVVSTYAGASQGDTGIYRPTQNSLMRSLGRPFNLPGREAMIIAIYQKVRPIDASTPTGSILSGQETVSVTPLRPIGHSLAITWRLNGSTISSAQNQTTLDLRSLGLNGSYTLGVEVVDTTSFVRDEAARNRYMRETRSWSIQTQGQIATPTRTRTPTSGGTQPTATRTRTRTPTSGGTQPTATRTRTRTPSSTGSYPAWAVGVSYSVGARVSYSGAAYQCLQTHTAQVGWEPPNVPALWQKL